VKKKRKQISPRKIGYIKIPEKNDYFTYNDTNTSNLILKVLKKHIMIFVITLSASILSGIILYSYSYYKEKKQRIIECQQIMQEAEIYGINKLYDKAIEKYSLVLNTISISDDRDLFFRAKVNQSICKFGMAKGDISLLKQAIIDLNLLLSNSNDIKKCKLLPKDTLQNLRVNLASAHYTLYTKENTYEDLDAGLAILNEIDKDGCSGN